jgi:hypothetical protein
VEGSKNEVTSLCGSDREVDRVQVSHFAHEDNVWVLAQNILQSVRKGQGVHIKFTLVDQRKVVFMNKFDRILDRHDVHRLSSIDLVNHRRKCRRLSRACGTGHQNQPSWAINEVVTCRWKVEVFHRLNFVRDHTEGSLNSSSLLVDVASKAREAWNLIGKIQFKVTREFLYLVIAENLEQRLLELLMRKRFSLNFMKVTMNTNVRSPGVRFEMDVRPVDRYTTLQEEINGLH